MIHHIKFPYQALRLVQLLRKNTISLCVPGTSGSNSGSWHFIFLLFLNFLVVFKVAQDVHWPVLSFYDGWRQDAGKTSDPWFV